MTTAQQLDRYSEEQRFAAALAMVSSPGGARTWRHWRARRGKAREAWARLSPAGQLRALKAAGQKPELAGGEA